MGNILGSVMGAVGATQLQTVILIAILVAAIFKPDRIHDWKALNNSLFLLIAAILLSSLLVLLPADLSALTGSGSGRGLVSKLLLFSLGCLTAASLYWLWASIRDTH